MTIAAFERITGAGNGANIQIEQDRAYNALENESRLRERYELATSTLLDYLNDNIRVQRQPDDSTTASEQESEPEPEIEVLVTSKPGWEGLATPFKVVKQYDSPFDSEGRNAMAMSASWRKERKSFNHVDEPEEYISIDVIACKIDDLGNMTSNQFIKPLSYSWYRNPKDAPSEAQVKHIEDIVANFTGNDTLEPENITPDEVMGGEIDERELMARSMPAMLMAMIERQDRTNELLARMATQQNNEPQNRSDDVLLAEILRSQREAEQNNRTTQGESNEPQHIEESNTTAESDLGNSTADRVEEVTDDSAQDEDTIVLPTVEGVPNRENENMVISESPKKQRFIPRVVNKLKRKK